MWLLNISISGYYKSLSLRNHLYFLFHKKKKKLDCWIVIYFVEVLTFYFPPCSICSRWTRSKWRRGPISYRPLSSISTPSASRLTLPASLSHQLLLPSLPRSPPFSSTPYDIPPASAPPLPVVWHRYAFLSPLLSSSLSHSIPSSLLSPACLPIFAASISLFMAINNVSEKYKCNEKSQNYTTPKSFLQQINCTGTFNRRVGLSSNTNEMPRIMEVNLCHRVLKI